MFDSRFLSMALLVIVAVCLLNSPVVAREPMEWVERLPATRNVETSRRDFDIPGKPQSPNQHNVCQSTDQLEDIALAPETWLNATGNWNIVDLGGIIVRQPPNWIAELSSIGAVFTANTVENTAIEVSLEVTNTMEVPSLEFYRNFEYDTQQVSVKGLLAWEITPTQNQPGLCRALIVTVPNGWMHFRFSASQCEQQETFDLVVASLQIRADLLSDTLPPTSTAPTPPVWSTVPAFEQTLAERPTESELQGIYYNRDAAYNYGITYCNSNSNCDIFLSNGDGAHFVAHIISAGGVPLHCCGCDHTTTVTNIATQRTWLKGQAYAGSTACSNLQVGDVVYIGNTSGCWGWGGGVRRVYNGSPYLFTHSTNFCDARYDALISNCSPPASYDCVHIDNSPPAIPSLNNISNSDGDGSYAVSWGAVAYATSYNLQEQLNGGSWSTVYSGASTSVNRTGRTPGTWCYKVRSCHSGGCSTYSASKCTTVKPDAPSLYDIANSDGDGNYTVDWSDQIGATTYSLQRQYQGGTWTALYTGANSSYNVTNATAGLSCYRVNASNAGGTSAWSTDKCTWVKPPAPTLYPISNPEYDGVYLISWSSATAADVYVLQEDDNSLFSSPTERYRGNTVQYAVTAQSEGTWYYRVLAGNAGGYSGWSNATSVVVIMPPGAPTLDSIGNSDGDGSYTVAWNIVSNTTGYTLEEATNSAFTGAVVVYSGSGTSTNISSKVPGTYYYRVKAYNSGGDSAWSGARSVIVVAPPSPPTLNAIANADGDGSYTISWISDGNATGYTLQEATNSSFAGATTAYSGSNVTVLLTGRASGKYYYRVRSSNIRGDSTWSNVRQVTVFYRAYMPLTLRDHLTYFGNPGEMEPNNEWSSANGPLISGRDYQGYPNDQRDYYSVYVRRPGTLKVSITNHTGQLVQLQLFYQDINTRVYGQPAPPWVFTYEAQPGWYYLMIYTGAGYNSTTPYTLRVTYPE